MDQKRVGRCFTCGHPTAGEPVARCPKCVSVSELIAELIRKQAREPRWREETRVIQIAPEIR